MSIFVRIWAAFSVVLLIGSYLMLNALQQQIKPNMRQVVEDTLADNANLIASLVTDDLRNQQLDQPEFDQKIQHALSRHLNAQIRAMPKTKIHQTLYITDAQGIVRYDSTGQATGQDYSRWNDVYLTLRGQYGARSTRANPDDENSSIMYVAAPIIDQGRIIGVVSIGKAGRTVQPYIEQAQDEMLQRAALMVLISLVLCTIVAWWLRRSINTVRRYALSLPAHGLPAPHFYSASELNDLTYALDQMRNQLEDRAYIEQYVHTLTHELKSPLTAIRASAELLQDDLPLIDQRHFAHSIHQQTQRLEQLVERLLLLVRLEQQQESFEPQRLNLKQLIDGSIQSRQSQLRQQQIQLEIQLPEALWIMAEPFWLGQAISNLLDNALDFTPIQGSIQISAIQTDQQLSVTFYNHAPSIPDYALSQVFDRYYSLPRPKTGRKSTGIGLTLVKQVIERHQGHVTIGNLDQGVCVCLTLPQSTST
ncbi:MAG: two-component system sensor histidine kinase CreC [Pseudomonadota bacterium]|nr:two-component system sensor histidine kinase CreC [Pseudomonadota bacterium]